ncbi:MAG: DUF4340 domain-containing protein [Myxococcales bacterium]|nr:MAG: DUF4340 domain-containing protein [Myxococcales bacterium]
MNWRLNLPLLAFFAAIIAYIVMFERHTLSDSELEGRETTLLPDFVLKHVSEIDLTYDGERLLFEQHQSNTAQPTWSLKRPKIKKPNRDAIDSLLATLEWTEALRRLEDVDAADRHALGFDAPRLTVRYRVGKSWRTVRIGNDDVRAQGVYVNVDDSETVFVAPSDFLSTLKKPGSAYFEDQAIP